MSKELSKLFDQLSSIKVAVIGDVMLDTYWWGNVERISPEAPVPIVAVSKKEKRIGGAGNVALNAEQLGASVTILTILGNDEDGIELKKILAEKNINTQYILQSDKRITTNKIRIISRNQQMMRLDAEQTNDIDVAEEKLLFDQIKKYIDDHRPEVVILEDYNKGILTDNLINEIISICNNLGIITTVDPKRKNFFSYKNATLFKPNLGEAVTGLNRLPEPVSIEMLQEIHEEINEKLSHSISLITLSENGIFYQKNDQKKLIPSHRRKIADVSGAGDTVIAVASLIYAATKDIDLSAEIANIAGGIVCEEVGTAPIGKQKLLAECLRLLT
ncbi:MAG: bifunctional ADP-heptose synthase [Ginsengibacter sp.]